MNESLRAILRSDLIAMANEDQHVLKEVAENGELGNQEYHPKIKAVHEKKRKRINNRGKQSPDVEKIDGVDALSLQVQLVTLSLQKGTKWD